MTETEKWINESLKSLPPLCAEVRRLSEENDTLRARFAKETGNQPPNAPLTPEQLLDLEGEPVWLGGKGLNRWDILDCVSTDGIVCFLRAALPMDSCGRTWFPFRRKPEEGTNAAT